MTGSVGRLHLPPVLREIADAAGIAAAEALAHAKGGTAIYVPRKIDGDHWLAQLVGMDEARAISEVYGGAKVGIPLGMSGALNATRHAALQALQRGASVPQAARAAGVTDRTVYNLIRRRGRPTNPDQLRLFDD